MLILDEHSGSRSVSELCVSVKPKWKYCSWKVKRFSSWIDQCGWSLWCNEGCKWLFCLLTEGSNSACVCSCGWSLWCNEGRKLLFCLLTEGSNSTCVCSVSSCSYVMKDCWLREVTLHVFAGGSSCSWSLWCNERYRWLFSVCWLREVILHVFAGGSSCGWSLWCNEGRKWLFSVCWLREVTLHAFAGVRAEPRGSADAWLHAFSPSGLCYLFPWKHRPGYFNTGKLFAFILYRDTDLDILT